MHKSAIHAAFDFFELLMFQACRMVQVMVQNYFVICFLHFQGRFHSLAMAVCSLLVAVCNLLVVVRILLVPSGLQFVDDGVQFANAGLKCAIFASTCTYNFSSMYTLAMVLCCMMVYATRKRKAKPGSSSAVGESNGNES